MQQAIFPAVVNYQSSRHFSALDNAFVLIFHNSSVYSCLVNFSMQSHVETVLNSLSAQFEPLSLR